MPMLRHKFFILLWNAPFFFVKGQSKKPAPAPEKNLKTLRLLNKYGKLNISGQAVKRSLKSKNK